METLLSPRFLSLLSLREALLFTLTCSLAAHLVFKKYEPNKILPLSFLLGVVPVLPTLVLHPHSSSVWQAAAIAYPTYYACLVLSIVIYRLSPFHPLAHYPGPLIAKTSKFWGLWITGTGKQQEYFKTLHDKYGPYVRVGPNELSFSDVDMIIPIMGPDGMPKGPMWEGRRNPDWHPSLIALRSTKEHARRRRPWNKAFSSTAVKGYEPIVIKRALQMVEELEKRGAVDLAKWMSFFTFDFMGDMAFGGGFELMSEDDRDGLWHLMEKGLQTVALTAHIPWASGFLLRMELFTKDALRFRAFSIGRATMRKQKGSFTKDLFHHLIDEDGLEPQPPSFIEVVSDGGLAIVAGSDTTASVMSNIFYYLLMNPDAYARLRAEVDGVFPLGEGDPFDAAKLAEMPFLNAVINETMRLQPAVASGSQRSPEVGSGGKILGDQFIPEGTAVFVPPYVIQRDPRYFSPDPDAFRPERWLPDEKGCFHMTPAAFIPFSYGPANCAGKNLALVEMRMLVALLVQRFDMRFADGFVPKRWEESLEDWFVMKKGELPVVLTTRG